MSSSVSGLTVRQRLAIGCTVAAPVLGVIGSGMLPSYGGDKAAREVSSWADGRSQHFVGALLFAVGLFLFIPASQALVRLFRGSRGRVAGSITTTVTAIGAAFLGAGILMWGTIATVLSGKPISRGTATTVTHALDTSSVTGVPWLVGLLMFVGLLATAITLLVTRDVPWWQAVLLILGVAGVFVGGNGPKGMALGLPMVAAMASLAYSASRVPPAAVIDPGQVPAQADAPAHRSKESVTG